MLLCRPIKGILPTAGGSRSIAYAARRSQHINLSRREYSNANQPKDCSVVFDVDGVLVRGHEPIKCAREALLKLDKNNIPWVLVTNGGGVSEQTRADAISKAIDYPVNLNQILLSHTPFKYLTNKYKSVYVAGGDKDVCRHVALGYGFEQVTIPVDIVAAAPGVNPFHRFSKYDIERYAQPRDLFSKEKPFKIDAIFVFNDPRDVGTDQQIIIDLLLSDEGKFGTYRNYRDPNGGSHLPIYFSNNDLLWATSYPQPRFGQGSFRANIHNLYRLMTGGIALDDHPFGKPFKITYDFAKKLADDWRKYKFGKSTKPATRTYMVGDNPASDIKGGNDAGWYTVLLRTGVFNDTDHVPEDATPNTIQDDVLHAVDHIVARESKK